MKGPNVINVQITDIEFYVSKEDINIREFDGYEDNLDENGEPTEEFVEECIDLMRESLRDEALYKIYHFNDNIDRTRIRTRIDKLLIDLISDNVGWTVNYIDWRLI